MTSRFAFAGILLALAPPVHAGDSGPRVLPMENGLYIQNFRMLSYFVDTQAQLCFVRGIGDAFGYAPIPCENLALRTEWQPILTWIKP
jgi:hypothetical protein